jgi:hypothetical protein
LIYKCGGIDKRTIEKFEKVSLTLAQYCLVAVFIPLPRHPALALTLALVAICDKSVGALAWQGYTPLQTALPRNNVRRTHH